MDQPNQIFPCSPTQNETQNLMVVQPVEDSGGNQPPNLTVAPPTDLIVLPPLNPKKRKPKC